MHGVPQSQAFSHSLTCLIVQLRYKQTTYMYIIFTYFAYIRICEYVHICAYYTRVFVSLSLSSPKFEISIPSANLRIYGILQVVLTLIELRGAWNKALSDS